MNKYITRILMVVIASAVIVGCVTTNSRSYSDPSYAGYKLKSTLVLVTNTQHNFRIKLEDKTLKRLAEQGVKVRGFTSLFPPTRKWSKSDIRGITLENGYDTLLEIRIGHNNTSRRVVGYTTNYNAYSTGYYGYGSSYSSPVVRTSRTTATRVVLWDLRSGRKVWVADLQTNSGGYIYSNDSITSADIAKSIIQELGKSGHIIIKKKKN